LTQGHDPHFIPASGSCGTNVWSSFFATLALLIGIIVHNKKERSKKRS
jgi:heme exporter protein D